MEKNKTKEDNRDDDEVRFAAKRDAAADVSLPDSLNHPEAQTPGSISGDIKRARLALDQIPELSAEQIVELTRRISSGYYTDPKFLRKISDEISKQLGGSKK